jgi:hypothetical protein
VELPSEVEDIDQLVWSAAERFSTLDNIPFAELCNDMTGYRLSRRHHRG